MMKKVLVLSLFFLSLVINAQEKHSKITNWQSDYSNAKEMAGSGQKPILVFFTGSDWCGPCKKLVADFFNSDEFNKIADKELVLYEADFPRNKRKVTDQQKKVNSKLKAKFDVNSYPTVLVIDNDEKILGRITGYNLTSTKTHFVMLNSILKKLKKDQANLSK